MRVALILLLTASIALLIASCAPPSDPPSSTKDGDRTSHAADATASPPVVGGAEGAEARAPGTAAEESAADGAPPVAGAAQDETAARAADATSIARRVIYQKLRGGVFVPRCSECGETQPEGAEECAGCGQALVPWRHESECPSCRGSGSCVRCGDDRPCMSCAASGVCPECLGSKSVAGKRCDECRGRGGCADCQGDGVRSHALGDFASGESYLTGICTTCVDGSGLCPSCATGEPGCLTCAGRGTCPDCDGTTACPWDRGDGLCATCGGAGREIVNGPPATPAERAWTARRADGKLLPGRVDGMPAPDFTVIVTKNGKQRPQALVPSKVDPISYYAAARDHTALDDAAGRTKLAKIAADRRLIALALRELARVTELDPKLGTRHTKRARELAALRAQDWMARARKAQQHGDRELAALMFAMVPTGDPESGAAVQVALNQLRQDRSRELAGLNPAARARRDADQIQRIARTDARVGRLLTRARARLEKARDLTRGAARSRLSFAAADAAVQEAERLVRADARRAPPAEIAWPVAPAQLLATARALRAEITSARAAEEIAGARFELGARLARLARKMGADVSAVQGMLDEAARGMMRRGVRVATPPPDED